MAEEPANGKSSDPGAEADERLQKVVEKIERELDATFEGRVREAEDLARAAERQASKGLDPEFEERMRDIEHRAEKALSKRGNQKAETRRRIDSDADGYRGLGYGITVAYALIGFMALGWFIGFLIDRFVGTDYGQPLGAVFGTILGIATAFWLINKS